MSAGPLCFPVARADGGSGKPRGVIGIHVDDGICGSDQVFHEVLGKLRAHFSFGLFEEGSFTFTGIRLRQWEDRSIEMDQCEYIEGIDATNVPRERRKVPESPLCDKETRQLRQFVGVLQYAAVHTRADLTAKVGEIQSAINSACVSHLLEANCILHEAKTSRVTLMIVPLQEIKVTFCTFSDASFASSKKLCAHQGTVIFATSGELLANQSAVVCPMAWSSKRIPRVVRSTLGAESVA